MDKYLKTGVVRQVDGEWQEYVNGRWYDWNDRPLCSCHVEDDGNGETGPHLTVVASDPNCARCFG